MGRRANGEGSIYKTGDGRWRGFVTVGTNGGKQVRKYRAAKTRNEVLTKLNKLKQEHQTGRVLTVSRATVRSFMESWLTEHIAAHKSRATEALYRSISENHIFPKIGDHQLQKLSPANVQTFVDKLATVGKKCVERSLGRLGPEDLKKFKEALALVCREIVV